MRNQTSSIRRKDGQEHGRILGGGKVGYPDTEGTMEWNWQKLVEAERARLRGEKFQKRLGRKISHPIQRGIRELGI